MSAKGNTNTGGGSKTARRDALLAIEERVRKQWEDNKVHLINAGDEKGDDRQKYMATFPYPYMNGVLHLGHGFTLAKAEFATRYQRLLGKTALYPFAFHCTGMPIAAAAKKLRAEIAMYGNPPVFPEEKVEEVKVVVEKKGAKGPKKKGKLAKKKSKKKYQWQILEEIGVPVEEIPNFADSLHWLHYFPPIAMDHLKHFGLYSDFRRSFITTEANPYYDAFVRWHFNTLREKGKIEFGTRNSIFSPTDDQPCADHDRSEGEGVGPQDYTLIKLKLMDVPDEVTALLNGEEADIYLPAATLRPETMYGQTNLFILPTGEYGVYRMANGDIFVCSPRSALNMSFQRMTATRGQPDHLGNVMGSLFLGKRVVPPMCTTYEFVYVLPLLTIKMNKGTGVVTSVPSDAPDDYAALMDLKNKEPLRAKFGITEEMVMPFEVIPIIHTPGLGDTPAKDLCIEKKVRSQNDKEKLAAIKKQCYLTSFTKGVMLVGEYKGQEVKAVKTYIKKKMIQDGMAIAYSEPESYVESRTGNECVVAAADQWYLTYGEEKWKGAVTEHVENTLHTYNPIAKKKFHQTLGWLEEWACSRTFGLGTKLPWDEKWVVESLSDSTIYMCYYTVSHFLQGDLNGQTTGSANIRPEQMTNDVWNHIFRYKEFPNTPETDIPVETLAAMRKEFEFWYPMDMRVSGKDLINNHLTMSLYNHAAVWDSQPEMWPRSFFTNGHLMINGDKMSKSTGNFMTLYDAMLKYGADATRFTLADAGDSLEDSNFEEVTANKTILRLTKEIAWMDEVLAVGFLSEEASDTFFDQVFVNQMNVAVNETKAHMDEMQYHSALASGFYALVKARDVYRNACNGKQMNGPLIRRWLEAFTIMVSPFCPFYAQNAWEKLGKEGFVVNASWPAAGPEDMLITRKFEYLKQTAHNTAALHDKAVKNSKRKKKGKQVEQKVQVLDHATILVADAYPAWQAQCLTIMQTSYDELKGDVPKNWVKQLVPQVMQIPEVKGNKKIKKGAMQFVGFKSKSVATEGVSALELSVPFDEKVLLEENIAFIMSGVIALKSVDVGMLTEEHSNLKTPAVPGKPVAIFSAAPSASA